jgi:hypothetical protein
MMSQPLKPATFASRENRALVFRALFEEFSY